MGKHVGFFGVGADPRGGGMGVLGVCEELEIAPNLL